MVEFQSDQNYNKMRWYTLLALTLFASLKIVSPAPLDLQTNNNNQEKPKDEPEVVPTELPQTKEIVENAPQLKEIIEKPKEPSKKKESDSEPPQNPPPNPPPNPPQNPPPNPPQNPLQNPAPNPAPNPPHRPHQHQPQHPPQRPSPYYPPPWFTSFSYGDTKSKKSSHTSGWNHNTNEESETEWGQFHAPPNQYGSNPGQGGPPPQQTFGGGMFNPYGPGQMYNPMLMNGQFNAGPTFQRGFN